MPVWLLFFCLCSFPAWAVDCPALSIDEEVEIETIHDGDTLRLTDGRRVRFVAINAPELSQEDRAAQALATEATDAAREFLSDTKIVQLHYGERKVDRYGRLLAHVYHPRRGSLEANLVALGLAFPIAIPPDVSLSACLANLADRARENNLGVWNEAYWAPLAADNLSAIEPGFRRVCGNIAKVDRTGALWLELQGDVVIRINRDDWRYFAGSAFDLAQAEQWLGRTIELWAWLQDRRAQTELMQRGFKRWVVPVRSPYVMRWASSCP